MIGILVTSILLSIWTEVGSDPPDDISGTDDPNWVGAWWIMFIVGFGLAFICSLPMLAFPKQLPGVAEIRYQEAEERFGAELEETEKPHEKPQEKTGEDMKTNEESREETKEDTEEIKEESEDNFIRNMIQIWKNPIFVTSLMGEVGDTILRVRTRLRKNLRQK